MRRAMGAIALGLAACGPPAPPPPAVRAPPVAAAAVRANAPERCAACHPEAVRVWRAGGHARSVRPATPATVSMPVPGRSAWPSPHEVQTRLAPGASPAGAGAIEMECLDDDGTRRSFPVRYVIGGSMLEMYLTDHGADARPQVLPAMYSRREGDWVPYWDIDFAKDPYPTPPDSPRFWTGRSRSFASYCHRCHSPRTGVRYDPDAGRYAIDWGAPEDLGVSCVACHGDATAHVAAAEAGDPRPPPPAVAPLPDRRIATDVDSCGACHVSAEWVSLEYQPGADFFDTFLPILLDDEAHMWPDGRYRDHAYLWLAHQLSACFDRGAMRCSECHDVHGDASPAVSRAQTLVACRRCHPVMPASCDTHAGVPAPPHGEVADCVGCHMSAIPIERGHGVLHDHRVATPDPTLTRLTGIPNACNTCHVDRDAAWAEARLAGWGARPRRLRWVEVALAAALRGEAGVVGALRDAAVDPGVPWALRATAVRLLGRWPDATSAALVLRLLREDPHPMVRASAAFACLGAPGPDALPALRAARREPRRVVRVMAAAALLWRGEPADLADALAEVEAVASAIPDHLEMHRLLATGYERAGRLADARRAAARALRLSPRDASLQETVDRLAAIQGDG